MAYKVCSKINCNKLISIDKRYCDKHEAEYEDNKKIYLKRFDEQRKDSKEFKFYRTPEWKLMVDVVKTKYKKICLYSYYKYNKIVEATDVHHIIELKDDYNKRLELSNLIPLSSASHRKVHGYYNKSEKVKQKMIDELLYYKKRWNEEFGG